MAAVVAVLGLAAWAGLSALGSHREGARRLAARAQVEGILDGLATVARVEGRLPCPDVDGDGIEDRTGAGACEGALGALPWLSLGVGEGAATDPWGRIPRYAVTAEATLDGALADPLSWPDEGLEVAGGDGTVARALVVVVSQGKNAWEPGLDPQGAEAENADGDSLFRSAVGAGDRDAARFDDLLAQRGAGAFALAMGRDRPPASAAADAVSLPTTKDALSADADITWTARGLGGVVQDSGLVALEVEGAEILAEGGTLAVDSPSGDRGLGVYSGAAPLTDTPALVEGGELGADAANPDAPRALTVRFDAPMGRLSLTLSGLEGWRMVDRAWLRANDPGQARCLTPPTAWGACRVAWIEGATLELHGEGGLLNSVTLRGCPTQGAGGSASFSDLGLGGGEIRSIRLIPRMVEDGTGAVIPGESSFFRLSALEAEACVDDCPAPLGAVEACP